MNALYFLSYPMQQVIYNHNLLLHTPLVATPLCRKYHFSLSVPLLSLSLSLSLSCGFATHRSAVAQPDQSKPIGTLADMEEKDQAADINPITPHASRPPAFPVALLNS
eukprot:TRINITY_DN2040_c0_g1_i3.p1 TRINITY_DN2040_c0_g1~~TRINITY_DN2040_c0_g1_i3.p1  ORF type:complete len:108 (+),score=17.65 TRINITY_DN2040_c0_g1_i3:286-609(+)